MFRWMIRVGVAAPLLLIPSDGWAIPVMPGLSMLAAAEPDPLGGVVVAGPMVSPLMGTAFSAILTSTVLRDDASNPFGGLTFVYELANQQTSSDPIWRFTANGYLGWLTDLSFEPGAATAPATMDLSIDGRMVGFSFELPPTGTTDLQPGQRSMRLVVQTNASEYSVSTGHLIDGGVASGPIYAPAPGVPVPEAATILPLLAGIGLLQRRRSRGFARRVCPPCMTRPAGCADE